MKTNFQRDNKLSVYLDPHLENWSGCLFHTLSAPFRLQSADCHRTAWVWRAHPLFFGPWLRLCLILIPTSIINESVRPEITLIWKKTRQNKTKKWLCPLKLQPHRQARNELAGGKTNSAPIKRIAILIEASNIWTNTDFCSLSFPPPTQSRDRRGLAGARQPSAASTIKTNNSIHLTARRGGTAAAVNGRIALAAATRWTCAPPPPN